MIMMGLEDMSDIPFSTVYLHGLIRDERGEKMSKIRGNVLNPIDTLEEYGTDALRFAVSTGTSPGNDIKLTSSRLEAGRNFANKLWNATRFIIRSIQSEAGTVDMEIQRSQLPIEDRWILSRLNRTIASTAGLMEDFQLGEAQGQIHDFLWGEFCDWYIELAKLRLSPAAKEVASPIPVLVHVLEASLRLLHPCMPFVTEELWQNLKQNLPSDWQKAESIMVASYPEADDGALDPESEGVMESIIEIIHSIRNARAEYRVETGRWIEVQVYAGELKPVIAPYSQAIQTLARARPVTFLDRRQEGTAEENAMVLLLKGADVVIPMEGMIDLEAEKKRLQKEIERSQTEVAQLEGRLKDEAFLTKAPEAVVDKERKKLYTLVDKLERLRQQISKF
jgi:valyl-tRNA synthetase